MQHRGFRPEVDIDPGDVFEFHLYREFAPLSLNGAYGVDDRLVDG